MVSGFGGPQAQAARMIFNCPSCQAGHSVPVSMIPNGGMELTCRRCGQVFAVDLPSQTLESGPTPSPLEATDEMAQPLPEREPEATTVGIENPFDELSRTGQAPLMAPSGQVVPERVEALEESTGTIPQTNVPLGPDETGVDPELDNTQRVDVDDEAPLGAPTISAPHPAKVERPPTNPDLYDRVERGDYVPEEPQPKAPEPPAPKAWNEPSGSVAAQKPKGPLRILADALNTAPLPLKVGLSVFPVALGLTLILTSSPEVSTSTKVEIAATAPDAGAESPAPTRVTMPPPGSPSPVAPTFEDLPAPEGHAYVQVDDARLRAKAQAKSPAVAKLEVGALVRLHPGTDDWALVVVEPEGPAGFLPKQLLGPVQPLAKLAALMAFERCEVPPGASVDPCLYDAKESQELCTERCGGVGKAPIRCVEACGAAFDLCTKQCFESAKVDRGKKRRR